MVTLKQTIHCIAADYRRRLLLLQGNNPSLLSQALTWFHPSMVSVLIYRVSRFCCSHHLGIFAKLLVIIEHAYCKNELSPLAIIGPGLVIDGFGIGIFSNVTIGSNCTLMGRNSLTLGGMENIDLARDRIVIGDHCVFGIGARVIRPVRLTSGTHVMPNSVVLADEETQGSLLCGVPAKMIQQNSIDQVMNWNPILSQRLLKTGASS